uniref:DUF2293 domain-containing protein n=1 Tax=Streptomyces scabiei TaxID=1930 RepID=UPI0038D3E8C5
MRGGGRVGRRAAGRALALGAWSSVVIAAVRTVDMPDDRLLMTGVPLHEARPRVAGAVEARLR